MNHFGGTTRKVGSVPYSDRLATGRAQAPGWAASVVSSVTHRTAPTGGIQTSNSVKVYLADWTTTPSPRRGLSRPVTPTLTLTPTLTPTTRTTSTTRTPTTRTTNTTPTHTPRTSTTTTRATTYTSTTTTESNRTTRATGRIPTATGATATLTATQRTT